MLLCVFIRSKHENFWVSKTTSTKHDCKMGSSGLVSILVLRLPEGLAYTCLKALIRDVSGIKKVLVFAVA